MSKVKALTTVAELKNQIEKLSYEDKQKTLRLAYNYNADVLGYLQHLSFTVTSPIQQMMCNTNMFNVLARKEFSDNASKILTNAFPYWTKARINEELYYLNSNSTLYYDRVEWELRVIYKHYLDENNK